MRHRSRLLIFLTFCAVGIVAGLAFAWLVAPVEPAGDTPARLNPADREVYVQLIADSFAANGDRDAAARRLGSLGPTAKDLLAEMIARDLTGGRHAQAAENLVALAAEVGIDTPVVAMLAQPFPISPATSQAPVEPKPLANSASPIRDRRYELVEQELLCMPGSDANRIEIEVIDSNGRPQSGAVITVFWDGGRDSFFTGFTPGQDAGYADFKMDEDNTYSVAMGDDEVSATALQTQLCADGRVGGWRLEYRAREP